METQKALRGNAADGVAAFHKRNTDRASRGESSRLTVGDHLMVARVTKQGQHHKLVSARTGPWLVVSDDRDHLYNVQNTVTGESRDVRVARMCSSSDE